MLNFGKYDQRIVIQNYSESRGSDGSIIRAFTTYATVWAKVKPTGGAEGEEANEKTANRIIEVEIRQGSLVIDETMRIVWRGDTYNITSIDDWGVRLRESYKIRAKAKDNDSL